MKILANRLKSVLPRIVGREQGAFVVGRNISDNILMATELFHSVTVARAPVAFSNRFILKLDMEKAFDRLSRRFILQALHYLGFPPTWVDWISGAISNPSFAVLINNARSPWFEGISGIRQGCPLSPFLFVLSAEILSRLFHHEMHFGSIRGVRLAPSLPEISHLFFADDVVIFGEASIGNCQSIMNVLKYYCSLSGQSMNSTKSRLIFSPRVPDGLRFLIQGILGVVSGSDIGFYLGIPFSAHGPKEYHFAVVKDKILKKLSLWKARTLSLAGRICLVKYSLMPILHYIFSHCCIPASILKWVDLQIRCFIWNHPPEVRKLHYIGWSYFCMPQRLGGAGILDSGKWYQANMLRRAFQVASDPSLWWVSGMRAKYGFRSWLDPGKKHYTSAFWRRIKREGVLATSSSSILIANGRDTDIWNDPWVPGVVLGRSGLVFHTEAFGIMSSLSSLLTDQQWDFGRVAFFLGPDMARLIASLGILIHPQLSADRWVWGTKKLACPKITDFYISLHGSDPMLARLAKVWKINCPEMVKLMMWKALMGKLPTRGLLYSTLGITDGMCLRCCSTVEDLDHLFFGCPFAKAVWCKVWRRVDIGLQIPSFPMMRDLIMASSSNPGWGLKVSTVAITMWQIWCARNRFTFDGKAISSTAACLNSLAMLELYAFPFMSAVGASRMVIRDSTVSGWRPSSPGALKLSFSGAWHPLSVSGIGFILYDATSSIILAGGRNVEAASHLFANIYAAAWALNEISNRFGEMMASVDMILECASATSIDWLAGNGSVSLPALLKARLIMGRFRRVDVAVCSSADSTIAWRLAEVGRCFSFPSVWDISCTPPDDLANALGLGGFSSFSLV